MLKQIKDLGIEFADASGEAIIPIQIDGITGHIAKENFLLDTGSVSIEYAQVADIKSSGVNGGSYPTALTTITRNLNTITSSALWLTLSSNAFTLQPGTYIIDATVPAVYVGNFKAWLADSSNNIISLGTPQYSSEGAPYVTAISTIKGKIIVTSATEYSVKFWASNARSQNYVLGIATGISGQSEVYTQVNITKVA
ncbi:MAG: hypothetical protein RM338_25635 [Nostoc sp. DedQUE12a]|nr:hypothetical protein [Nostoc sp. DedQUE12a]